MKKDDEKDNRFTRALLKYRRNKERKKEEDSSKKASASKVNKSERVIEIAKELEPKLSKQMVPDDQKEEKEETPIIQVSLTYGTEEPETNNATLKTKKKKKAMKQFEDN